jgi:DNA-binding transcriptional MerR regulator
VQLVRIGELAKRSGVPIATLKFYLREGLIAPTRKSGRTMSWYDPALASRVQAIKELQQQQFLPLDVIREALDGDAKAPDELAAADAIAKVLTRHGGARRAKTRAEILDRGMATERELDVLAAMGLAVPGRDGRYRGDDLALLSTLGAARQAGISADMLPFSIVNEYLVALRALVAAELKLFRDGVIKRAEPGKVGQLTTVATELSERLVVLVRRRLLIPTLSRLMEEDRENSSKSRSGDRRVRQQHGRQRKLGQRRGRAAGR